MEKGLIFALKSRFDNIAHVDEESGIEFWYARELQKELINLVLVIMFADKMKAFDNVKQIFIEVMEKNIAFLQSSPSLCFGNQ